MHIAFNGTRLVQARSLQTVLHNFMCVVSGADNSNGIFFPIDNAMFLCVSCAHYIRNRINFLCVQNIVHTPLHWDECDQHNSCCRFVSSSVPRRRADLHFLEIGNCSALYTIRCGSACDCHLFDCLDNRRANFTKRARISDDSLRNFNFRNVFAAAGRAEKRQETTVDVNTQ